MYRACRAIPVAAALLASLAWGGLAAGAPADERRGRALLKAQLDALGDEQAFAATFADDASVLTPHGSGPAHQPVGNLAASVASLGAHDKVVRATFDHFTAGGNAQVAWLCAELQLTIASRTPGQPATTEHHTLRAIELVDVAAGDKVAVAAFTEVAPLTSYGTSAVGAPTDAGPLTGLLAAPAQLAAALAEGAVVFGTGVDERSRGADARKRLTQWSQLAFSLDPASGVREVHAPSYGFAIANLRIASAKAEGGSKVSAFVLALPDPSARGWSVVAVSYGAVR